MDRIELLKKLCGYIESNCEYLFPFNEFKQLTNEDYECEVGIDESYSAFQHSFRFVSKRGLLWIAHYYNLGLGKRQSDESVCVYLSQMGSLSKGVTLAPKAMLFMRSDIEGQKQFQLTHQTRQ